MICPHLLIIMFQFRDFDIFKSVSEFYFLIGFMIVNGNLVSRQWSFLKLFELVKIIQITFIELYYLARQLFFN